MLQFLILFVFLLIPIGIIYAFKKNIKLGIVLLVILLKIYIIWGIIYNNKREPILLCEQTKASEKKESKIK